MLRYRIPALLLAGVLFGALAACSRSAKPESGAAKAAAAAKAATLLLRPMTCA